MRTFKNNKNNKNNRKVKKISMKSILSIDMKKYTFPIKSLKMDDNSSFSHFRSYITFFNYLHIHNISDKNLVKRYFIDFYKNSKYFDLFYDNFYKFPNPLIFTYYNNIPLNFFPYPKEFFFYFPYITFCNTNNKKFYNQGNIFFKEKLKYRGILNETFKTNHKEIQTSIPVEYFKKYKLPKKYFLAIKVNSEFIITDNIKLKGEEYIINNYFINKKKIEKEKRLKHQDINYLNVLLPLTKELFDRIFSKEIIKKDGILYHMSNKEIKLSWMNFTFLYPKHNSTDMPNSICYRLKIKKNFKALNLNLDIFYDNEIVYKKKNYKYLSYTDTNYKELDEDKIFRCINTDKKMTDRLKICNIPIKKYNFYEGQKKTHELTFLVNGKRRKNVGKDFLNIIIFKNRLITEYRIMFYINFLKEYNIKNFIWHWGYFQKSNKLVFGDTELYMENSHELLEIIDKEEGYCSDLYKKGKLLK
jgi:hypothetical protein